MCMRTKLPETIRKAIQDSGLNRFAIEHLSGVNRATLGRFVRDERTITVETADRVLAALGLSVKLVRTKGAK